jgi:UPF0271 protein
VEGEHFMTPRVEAELQGKKTKSVMDLSVATGYLKIRSPREEFVNIVKSNAGSSGDISVLSQTDLEVVALALELKSEGADPTVVSDDYSLQNLCTMMKINFKPMATKGISEEFWWFLYCPACGATYKHSLRSNVCQVCGHQLKRKVYSKKRITAEGKDASDSSKV